MHGPCLVLAGAGSGKTRVITHKIVRLLQSGLRPEQIAAITFTNKAAREMRDRVAKRVKGEAAEGLMVTTFHSLGLRFLQIEHERAGLRRGFSIFDADDQMAIIKDLAPKGLKNDALFALQNLVSAAKNNALTPEQAAEAARSVRVRVSSSDYALPPLRDLPHRHLRHRLARERRRRRRLRTDRPRTARAERLPHA